MRRLVAVALALIAVPAVSAEVIVGTATLEYQAKSLYQPGLCVTSASEEAQNEACIVMWPWLRHGVVEFIDLKGQVRNIGSVVVSAQQALAGKWLLVIEELSDEEARRFDAQYKAIVHSPVLLSDMACQASPAGDC